MGLGLPRERATRRELLGADGEAQIAWLGLGLGLGLELGLGCVARWHPRREQLCVVGAQQDILVRAPHLVRGRVRLRLRLWVRVRLRVRLGLGLGLGLG